MKLKKVKQLLAMALSAAMIVGSVPVSAGSFERAENSFAAEENVLLNDEGENSATPLPSGSYEITEANETETLTLVEGAVAENNTAYYYDGDDDSNVSLPTDWTADENNWKVIDEDGIDLTDVTAGTPKTYYIAVKADDPASPMDEKMLNTTTLYSIEISRAETPTAADVVVSSDGNEVTLTAVNGKDIECKVDEGKWTKVAEATDVVEENFAEVQFRVAADKNANILASNDDITFDYKFLEVTENLDDLTATYGDTLEDIVEKITTTPTVKDDGSGASKAGEAITGTWSVAKVDEDEKEDQNEKLGANTEAYTLELTFTPTNTEDTYYAILTGVETEVTVVKAATTVEFDDSIKETANVNDSVTLKANVSMKEGLETVDSGTVEFTVTEPTEEGDVGGGTTTTANDPITANVENGVATATTALTLDKVGSYTVTAAYKTADDNGNFADSMNDAEKTINVSDPNARKTDLADATVTFEGVEDEENASFTYTGNEIKPAVVVKVGEDQEEVTLIEGTDYTVTYPDDCTNVGDGEEKTVTITAAADSEKYFGTTTATYTIAPATITADDVAVDVDEKGLEYNGQAQTPAVTVTVDGNVLEADKDYTVAYEDNENVGTATVKVTGIGNYTTGAEDATVDVDYTIAQATVPAVVLEKAYTYPASVIGEQSIALGLPEYVTGGITAAGAASDSNFASDSVKVENGVLKFTFDASATAKTETITLTFENQTNYKFSDTSATVDIILSDQEVTTVTPSITGTTTKVYDGTTDATGLTIALKKVDDETPVTDVTATATFAYDNANAGKDKTITASNVILTGANAAMYKLPDNFESLTTTGVIEQAVPAMTLNAGDITEGTSVLTATVKGVKDEALTGTVKFYDTTGTEKQIGTDETLQNGTATVNWTDLTTTKQYSAKVVYEGSTNYKEGNATVTVGSNGGTTPPTGGDGGAGGGATETPTPEPTPTPEVTPTPNPEPTPEVKDPTTAETETVQPDENGNASVEADAVKDAIADAKAEAEKNGTTENGIAVTVPVANDGEKVNVTIDAAAADALVEAAAKKLEIKAEDMMAAGLDAALLKTLVTEGAGADIVLSVEKVKDAPAAVGKRPVYDVKLGYVKEDGITWIGDLGTNKIQLKFPYVPAQSEAHEKLYGVHIGEDGKVNWLKVCDYNADTKEVSFETTHFSLYGVAYLDLDATPVKVEKKDTKSVTINWASADLAEGYTVWYHKEGETENKRKVVNGADITTWTQARLTAGTKYFYAVRPWVKTLDGYVFGDETSFVRGTTKPQAAKIRTVTAKDGKVKVALAGEAAGAEKYSMCYSTDADFEDFAVGVRTSYTTRTFKNTLEPGTYYVKVKSYRDLGNGKRVYGEWSNAKKVTVK